MKNNKKISQGLILFLLGITIGLSFLIMMNRNKTNILYDVVPNLVILGMVKNVLAIMYSSISYLIAYTANLIFNLMLSLFSVKIQFLGIGDLLSTISYLLGIGLGIQAALRLKEHNEGCINGLSGAIPLSQPLTLAIVSALLLALPTFLSVGRTCCFAGCN